MSFRKYDAQDFPVIYDEESDEAYPPPTIHGQSPPSTLELPTTLSEVVIGNDFDLALQEILLQPQTPRGTSTMATHGSISQTIANTLGPDLPASPRYGLFNFPPSPRTPPRSIFSHPAKDDIQRPSSAEHPTHHLFVHHDGLQPNQIEPEQFNQQQQMMHYPPPPSLAHQQLAQRLQAQPWQPPEQQSLHIQHGWQWQPQSRPPVNTNPSAKEKMEWNGVAGVNESRQSSIVQEQSSSSTLNGAEKSSFSQEDFMRDHSRSEELDEMEVSASDDETNQSTTGKSKSRKQRSKPAGCSSRFRGVSWQKRDKKWVARIWAQGKSVHLGTFRSEIKAAQAVDERLTALYGAKAELNFPRHKE